MLWSDRRIRLITTKEHSGAMVALMLDESDSAALLSALPPDLVSEENLHITLAYLGDAALLTLQQVTDIDDALRFTSSMFGPIVGTISGIGYFNQDELGSRVLYASYDAPQLPEMRQALIDAMAEDDLPVDNTHGFTPHITLAYCGGDEVAVPDVPTVKITFPALTRMLAGDRIDFPLGPETGFMVKEVAGEHHWVLISSNSYQDRDGEIVTQKALEDDVLRADTDGDYGPLLWWHEKSIVLGQCTGNAMHNRMLIEWGTFKSAAIAEKFKQAAGTLGISIGFNHPVSQPDAQGLFHTARRFERSALPHDVASNPLTAIPLIHQEESTMLKEKIDALRKVFGGDEALVNSVISMADTHQKAAEEAGIRTKAKMDDDEKKLEADAPPPGEDAAADKPFTKDEATDEEDPKKAKKEFVGDMDPATLKHILTEIVDSRMTTLKAELQTQLDTVATTKAESEKAYAESIKSLDAKLDGISKSATDALKGVAELKGELPRALGERLKGYHPSTDGEIAGEEFKDKRPVSDTVVDKFMASLGVAPTN